MSYLRKGTKLSQAPGAHTFRPLASVISICVWLISLALGDYVGDYLIPMRQVSSPSGYWKYVFRLWSTCLRVLRSEGSQICIFWGQGKSRSMNPFVSFLAVPITLLISLREQSSFRHIISLCPWGVVRNFFIILRILCGLWLDGYPSWWTPVPGPYVQSLSCTTFIWALIG